MEKDIIRKNRQDLKSRLKGSFVSFDKNHIPLETSQGFQEREKRYKRYMSEDLTLFEMNYQIPAIYTSQAFQKDFTIGNKIGQGSQSVVYKCIQNITKQIFSVKVIKSSQLQTIFRIKQKFQILKELKHPNILEAHALYIDQEEHRNYIVTKYLPFPTLDQFLRKQQLLGYGEVERIIFEILKGVKYLHQNGVCHRDLKPENIMYDPEFGRIVLIDFEIAVKKAAENQQILMLTKTGSLLYRAPEIFKGGCYSLQIDIWALGVIAYQLIYGQLPFYSESQKDFITQIQDQEPDYKQNKPTSKFDQHFVRGCLQKQPLKRFTAVQALCHPYLAAGENKLTPLTAITNKQCGLKVNQTSRCDKDRAKQHKASDSTWDTGSCTELEKGKELDEGDTSNEAHLLHQRSFHQQ